MPIRTLLLVTVSAPLLMACASVPGASANDKPAFKQAVQQHDLAPIPVVPRTMTGTVVGPSLPPAATAAKPETTSPTVRVETANTLALHEPASNNYLNAVQVYPFSDNALYRLYAAPQQVSDISLQPGETLSAISAGDTVRWAVGDTTSGSGQGKQVHVLVKPFSPGLKTNLVILTDKRTYHLELQSTDRVSMAAVSWNYPNDSLVTDKHGETSTSMNPTTVDSGIALENLNFRYAISGNNPPWRPLRAFDDGRKVYIEFPKNLGQGEAPPLFVVGANGGSDLVNYRVRGNYYIVDRLFGAAELRLGQDKQQIVRISRTEGTNNDHGLASIFGG